VVLRGPAVHRTTTCIGLQILARPGTLRRRTVTGELLGDIRLDDRAERSRILRLRGSGHTSRLCGDDLVEQPHGQARVTGRLDGLDLGQEVGCLAFGFRRQRQASVDGQRGEDRAELGGRLYRLLQAPSPARPT
jgi:hypothetical protein